MDKMEVDSSKWKLSYDSCHDEKHLKEIEQEVFTELKTAKQNLKNVKVRLSALRTMPWFKSECSTSITTDTSVKLVQQDLECKLKKLNDLDDQCERMAQEVTAVLKVIASTVDDVYSDVADVLPSSTPNTIEEMVSSIKILEKEYIENTAQDTVLEEKIAHLGTKLNKLNESIHISCRIKNTLQTELKALLESFEDEESQYIQTIQRYECLRDLQKKLTFKETANICELEQKNVEKDKEINELEEQIKCMKQKLQKSRVESILQGSVSHSMLFDNILQYENCGSFEDHTINWNDEDHIFENGSPLNEKLIHESFGHNSVGETDARRVVQSCPTKVCDHPRFQENPVDGNRNDYANSETHLRDDEKCLSEEEEELQREIELNDKLSDDNFQKLTDLVKKRLEELKEVAST